ncbi:MAG: cyclic nucleotide-binding domain-containing protein, partial [Candidatus Dormibacteria bacterium]
PCGSPTMGATAAATAGAGGGTMARDEKVDLLAGRPVAILGPGDYFGEVGVLASKDRNAQVTARTEMSALVLERREFLGMLAEIRPLNRTVLGGMASRLHSGDVAQQAG